MAFVNVLNVYILIWIFNSLLTFIDVLNVYILIWMSNSFFAFVDVLNVYILIWMCCPNVHALSLLLMRCL